MRPEQTHRATLVLSVVLATVICAIDLLTPLGLAEGFVYLLPVLFASRVEQRFYPYLFTVVCTEMILLGYVQSPPGTHDDYAFIGRCLAIAMLWTTTVFLVTHNRVEKALRERELFYRLISDSMTDMVAVIRRDGRRLYNSPSYSRVLGDPEALVGTNSFDEIHPDDRQKIKEIFQATLRTRVGQRTDYRFLLKNGVIRYIESQGSVIEDADGEVGKIVIVSRDITERVNLEAQLRQSQKMEAVGQLAAGVAHDFNNLLGVIYGYTQRLLSKRNLDNESAELVRQIYGVAERASNLTRQLLGFSRKQAMQLQILNFNELIQNLGQMLRRTLGADIQLELPAVLPPLAVEADTGMIEQVILNLVVNARDAMPQGGRVVIETAEVEIDAAYVAEHPAATAGKFACMKVSDTGTGMDSVTLSRIFEPFFTTKAVGKGTGLGLSTVYGIVSQHHGWVEVTSRLGHGTTFLIFLPRCSREVEAKGDTTFETAPGGAGETVLLVEDEPVLRELTQLMIEDRGYKVLSAGSGTEALQLWAAHKPEIRLLLTDMVLPGGLNGQELAAKLRAERPQLGVIFTSGYGSDQVGQELQANCRFLQKPFQGNALARVLRDCLKDHQA